MLRKAMYIAVVLLLLGGAIGGAECTSSQSTDQGECPAGYTSYVVLESLQEGTQSSRVIEQGCRPVETSEQVFLNPIRPGDEGWEIEPYRPTEQAKVVLGPSEETVYRCVIFLEPILSGEESSRASEPVCSTGKIDAVEGHSLVSSYLIAKFYDNTNYTTLLVEYYGASACSSTTSYGVTTLPSNLNNKFASGQSYSNCNRIYVYDFNNYGGPSYSCGPNCSSFYALNDYVSSWRTTQ
ncbi:MAG: hypothetical protein IBX69_15890 [Anaerolineales bacterium]|nr:hypothetical protein [Anaerolineales bacterium]